VTDEAGRFMLSNLRPGMVEGRVQKEGFAPWDFEVRVPSETFW